jgi:hypothetical protein
MLTSSLLSHDLHLTAINPRVCSFPWPARKVPTECARVGIAFPDNRAVGHAHGPARHGASELSGHTRHGLLAHMFIFCGRRPGPQESRRLRPNVNVAHCHHELGSVGLAPGSAAPLTVLVRTPALFSLAHSFCRAPKTHQRGYSRGSLGARHRARTHRPVAAVTTCAPLGLQASHAMRRGDRHPGPLRNL